MNANRVECPVERSIKNSGFILVHDGQGAPDHPVQGGFFKPEDKKFFTRRYIKQVDGRTEEAVFKYDLRRKLCVYFDMTVRESKEEKRVFQRMESRVLTPR